MSYGSFQSEFSSFASEQIRAIREVLAEMRAGNADASCIWRLTIKLTSLHSVAGLVDRFFVKTICHNLEDFLKRLDLNQLTDDQVVHAEKFVDVLSSYALREDTIGRTELNAMKQTIAALSTIHEDSTGHRALILDNGRSIVAGIMKVLTELKVEFSHAENGLRGLSRLVTEDFDSCIVGEALATIKGNELVTILPHLSVTNKNLHVTLLTADDRDLAPRTGVEVLKLDAEMFATLKDRYQKLLKMGHRFTDQSFRIVCVDDDQVVLELLKIAFWHHPNLDVEYYLSPLEAVERVRDNPPDLLLLDVMMPELDGVETLGKIKEFHQDLDVIFLTATDTQDQVRHRELMDAGARGIISKPFRTANLAKMIDDILK